MERRTPDFEALKRLYEEKKDKFSAFCELLLFYNSRFNLTSVTLPDEIYHKHFLDSLAGEACFPHGAAVAEVGSGAGFPSVPLLIVREDLKFTLFESTGKKCDFLRTAVRELGLSADVVCMRAEDAGRGGYRETFGAVTARAVAKLHTLAEYCIPLLAPGGVFVAYKGSAEELSEGRKAIRVLGGGEPETICYELPAGYGKRTLIVSEKEKPTPSRYPRGRGLERRDPIV